MSQLDEIIEILKSAQDNDKYLATLERLAEVSNAVEVELIELRNQTKEVSDRITAAETKERDNLDKEAALKKFEASLSKSAKDFETFSTAKQAELDACEMKLNGLVDKLKEFLGKELEGL